MKRILAFIVTAYVIIDCNSGKKSGEALPSFDLLLVDSITHFNTAKIPEGKPVVLMYFSPDCSHCQNETRDIISNMNSLKEVLFYFVTNDPSEKLCDFDKMFKLYKYPNIILGRDYKYFFPGHFKNVAPPYSVVYDEDKIARAVFEGDSSVNQIISLINTL
jgi:hypothetical protein